jgi:hypothetical protein
MPMRTRVLCFVAITILFSGQSRLFKDSVRAQEQAASPRHGREKIVSQSPDSAARNEVRQRLFLRILETLRTTADGAKQWNDAIASSRVQAQVANLIWESEPETAKNYLVQAWTTTGRLEQPKQERSRFRNESVRDDARREVMLIARKRAPTLAKKWLEQLAEEAEAEQKGQQRGAFDERTTRSAVLLSMALQAATENPNAAAELAIESLVDGISFGFQQVLIEIQRKDFDLAQTVFRAALSRLRTLGMVDPNELLILYSYLYSPGRIVAANSSDNRSSIQFAVGRDGSRVLAAAQLNPTLALEFLNLAADLLTFAPAPSTTPDPQSTARAQINVIAALLTKMSQQLPEKAVALQTRAQQLEADAHFATVPRPSRTDTPVAELGESRKNYGERRVDLLEQAAQNERDSLSRGIAYAKAALATDVESYQRGWDLSGKIDDETLCDNVRNWLTYRAVLHFVRTDNLEKAYQLNAKNSDPIQRGASLVVGAQRLVKAKDTIRAAQWLREAHAQIRKTDTDNNSVRVALGVVSVYGKFDSVMAFDSLSDAVRLINKTNLHLPDNDRAPLVKKFSGLGTQADFTYGSEGFGLKAAIAAFPPDQFEDVLGVIGKITVPEVRGLAILELCRNYLGATSKVRPEFS